MDNANHHNTDPVDPAAVPLIRLAGVDKTYRMGLSDVHALADITVDFESGEFWAVMGSSGSGKSTLLNLLGCLDRPTSGLYLLKGRDVGGLDDDNLSEARLAHLGFVFQSFNLISQLTVVGNIELPLYYLGWNRSRSAERACELADSVGLGDRLNHRPAELSGGQQQRVAIARALANDPEIILADEPTGNLDTPTSVPIMKLLCQLNEQGRTVILVTHEDEVARHASKRLMLRDGRIERIVEAH